VAYFFWATLYIRCLCQTAVYDAVNQTLVNKRGHRYALVVSEKSN